MNYRNELERALNGQLVDQFHAHLDVCQQCRDHPFSLCPVGFKLLSEVQALSKSTEPSLFDNECEGMCGV